MSSMRPPGGPGFLFDRYLSEIATNTAGLLPAVEQLTAAIAALKLPQPVVNVAQPGGSSAAGPSGVPIAPADLISALRLHSRPVIEDEWTVSAAVNALTLLSAVGIFAPKSLTGGGTAFTIAAAGGRTASVLTSDEANYAGASVIWTSGANTGTRSAILRVLQTGTQTVVVLADALASLPQPGDTMLVRRTSLEGAAPYTWGIAPIVSGTKTATATLSSIAAGGLIRAPGWLAMLWDATGTSTQLSTVTLDFYEPTQLDYDTEGNGVTYNVLAETGGGNGFLMLPVKGTGAPVLSQPRLTFTFLADADTDVRFVVAFLPADGSEPPNRKKATYPITVGTAATQLDVGPAAQGALSGRRYIAIFNNGSATIYLGDSNAVTTATGFAMPAGTGDSFDAGEFIQWWAISGTAGQDVRVQEVG